MLIVGVEERKGEYEGRAYRFFNCYAEYEDRHVTGKRTEKIKVPGDVFDDFTGTPESVVGLDCSLTMTNTGRSSVSSRYECYAPGGVGCPDYALYM